MKGAHPLLIPKLWRFAGFPEAGHQEPSKADDTSGFYVESSEVKQWNGKEVKVVHAGDSRANGEYKISGYHEGRPEYTHITNDRILAKFVVWAVGTQPRPAVI